MIARKISRMCGRIKFKSKPYQFGILIFIYFYFMNSYPEEPEETYIRSYISPTVAEIKPVNLSNLKKILFYNSFEHPTYFMEPGQQFFEKNCMVKNCEIFGYEDNKYPETEMDALVYHPLGNVRRFPKERSPKTWYILHILESPPTYKVNYEKYSGIFNYTMTYLNDTDIYGGYGGFKKREVPLEKFEGLEITKHKTDLMAWFSSTRCTSHSKREQIVRSLQDHFKVDIYGRCGTLFCPRTRGFECYEMLERKYKFYLAFENSLCQDYVTEKMFNISRYYVVPIVYGAADYAKIAPPKSFINVMDFDNITHLVNYIEYLDKNETAYLEYFEWKKTAQEGDINLWCELCAALNKGLPPKIYEDMHKYYVQDKCRSPNSFLDKFLQNQNRSNRIEREDKISNYIFRRMNHKFPSSW